MEYRTLGNDLTVSAVGLGCMGMSHAYGAPANKKEMTELLAQAVGMGYTFFDTAEVYDTSTQHANLKFMKLIPLSAKVNCTSANMDLLFNSDKLLKLITLISSKSNNTTLKTIGSLANSYDGMMLGFALKKE